MHLIGALLLAAVIGAFTVSYLGRASARVADHGTPRARRAARGGRRAASRGKQAAAKGAAEIWAEVKAADWLERRRNRRAARQALGRAGGRGAAAAARGTGRAVAGTARGVKRGTGAVFGRVRGKRRAGDAPQPAPQGERCGWCGVAAGTACAEDCRCPVCEQRKGAPPFIKGPGNEDMHRPQTTSPGRGLVPMTSVSTGSSEKLIEGVNQVHAEAAAGGIHAKHAGIKACGEGAIRFAAMLHMLARAMSEPGQNYGPEITEPLHKAATQIQGAGLAISESDSSLSTLINSTVGDLARSPRQAPHHTELSENGSR